MCGHLDADGLQGTPSNPLLFVIDIVHDIHIVVILIECFAHFLNAWRQYEYEYTSADIDKDMYSLDYSNYIYQLISAILSDMNKNNKRQTEHFTLSHLL